MKKLANPLAPAEAARIITCPVRARCADDAADNAEVAKLQRRQRRPRVQRKAP